MSASDPVRVSIGLIEQAGRFLIRKRPNAPGSPMPGLWEFPGGKCELDETPEAAVVRESLEETGLVVRVTDLRRTVTHHYPHGLIELHYFDCVADDSTSEPLDGSGFLWVDASELPNLEFPAANAPILCELAGLKPPHGETGT